MVIQGSKNNAYNDFRKYATDKTNVSGTALDSYYGKVMYPQFVGSRNGYISPTIIEERQLNVAQMDVFSRLIMDRIIFLGSEIDDFVSNVIIAQLLYLDSTDSRTDIDIYINSPGGSVYSGYAIYDVMQFVKPSVKTYCVGCAASMAAVILAGGENGKRLITPHSRVMIHQPLGGVQGQASDIEITAKEILKIKDEIYQILSKHTGKPFDEIRDCADRDKWFTAEEAVEFGLVDDIVG